MTARLCRCGCGQPAGERVGRRGPHPLYAPGHQPTFRPPAGPPSIETYVEQVFDLSVEIVGAVHDEGPDMVLRHLRRLTRLEPADGVNPLVVLVTALAAQVDPDAPESRRVGWVEAFAGAGERWAG